MYEDGLLARLDSTPISAIRQSLSAISKQANHRLQSHSESLRSPILSLLAPVDEDHVQVDDVDSTVSVGIGPGSFAF